MVFNRKAILFLLLGSLLVLSACSNNNTAGKNKKETSVVTQNIKTDELKENIGKDDWVIVDTRANDAFNGWALDGVKGAGHIKDAVDFSADWLKVKVDKQDEKLTRSIKK